jgi:undecaprenyl diphosphate synthase
MQEPLIRQIDRDRLPRHIATIMDDNGRWAARQGLPRVEGHRAGAQAVRETIEAAAELGLEVLTLYALSVENWRRRRYEVWTLMNLLKDYLRREFRGQHIWQAIVDYQSRDRRFGAVSGDRQGLAMARGADRS